MGVGCCDATGHCRGYAQPRSSSGELLGQRQPLIAGEKLPNHVLPAGKLLHVGHLSTRQVPPQLQAVVERQLVRSCHIVGAKQLDIEALD